MSLEDSFLVRDGGSCPLPPLRAGTMSGLNLCKSPQQDTGDELSSS